MTLWVGAMIAFGAQCLLHDTLRVSCRKTAATNTAERLMLHKNTVHYWMRKAEEGLGASPRLA